MRNEDPVPKRQPSENPPNDEAAARIAAFAAILELADMLRGTAEDEEPNSAEPQDPDPR